MNFSTDTVMFAHREDPLDQAINQNSMDRRGIQLDKCPGKDHRLNFKCTFSQPSKLFIIVDVYQDVDIAGG